MNPDHSHDSPSGHLIRAGTGETAYWAFVPHPLPPEIPPDWELTCVTSEADRALSELAGVGRTMPNPHLLIGPFVRREAVLSSRIEGTQANITDLYAYEAGQLPLPGEANILQQIGESSYGKMFVASEILSVINENEA